MKRVVVDANSKVFTFSFFSIPKSFISRSQYFCLFVTAAHFIHHSTVVDAGWKSSEEKLKRVEFLIKTFKSQFTTLDNQS